MFVLCINRGLSLGLYKRFNNSSHHQWFFYESVIFCVCNNLIICYILGLLDPVGKILKDVVLSHRFCLSQSICHVFSLARIQYQIPEWLHGICLRNQQYPSLRDRII